MGWRHNNLLELSSTTPHITWMLLIATKAQSTFFSDFTPMNSHNSITRTKVTCNGSLGYTPHQVCSPYTVTSGIIAWIDRQTETTDYQRQSNRRFADYNTRKATQTFAQPSKKAGSEMGSLRNDRSRFARSPFGGSLVILTPEQYQEQSSTIIGWRTTFIDFFIDYINWFDDALSVIFLKVTRPSTLLNGMM